MRHTSQGRRPAVSRIEGYQDRENFGMCGMLFVPTHHCAARHRSNRPRKLLVIHQNMQPANGHGMPDWTTTLIDIGLTQPERRVRSLAKVA
jgi:hypothetical protein